jgi:hypothetical protein
MSNLTNALQQLRGEHRQAQQQVEKLQSAILLIEGLVGLNRSAPSRNGAQPARKISAASRSRMARAQKARWAKVKNESQSGAAKTSTAPARRTMSAAVRRKIAATQRARWAKVRKAA